MNLCCLNSYSSITVSKIPSLERWGVGVRLIAGGRIVKNVTGKSDGVPGRSLQNSWKFLVSSMLKGNLRSCRIVLRARQIFGGGRASFNFMLLKGELIGLIVFREGLNRRFLVCTSYLYLKNALSSSHKLLFIVSLVYRLKFQHWFQQAAVKNHKLVYFITMVLVATFGDIYSANKRAKSRLPRETAIPPLFKRSPSEGSWGWGMGR